jgi:hypothetical protein
MLSSLWKKKKIIQRQDACATRSKCYKYEMQQEWHLSRCGNSTEDGRTTVLFSFEEGEALGAVVKLCPGIGGCASLFVCSDLGINFHNTGYLYCLRKNKV